jgi:hypothetical protein
VYFAEANLTPEVVKHLPKEHALAFLRSLDTPQMANTCRFEQKGVGRWWNGVLPGSTPYHALYVSFLGVAGTPVGISLSVKGTNEQWCAIYPQPIAEGMRKDVTKFKDKILTALLSLGAEIIPPSELARGLTCRAEFCQPVRKIR